MADETKRGRGRPDGSTEGPYPIPTSGPERNVLERMTNSFVYRPELLVEGKSPWAEVKTITPEIMALVLVDVANGRSIITAARAAGTSAFSVLRQRVANKEFGDAMNEAIEIRQGLLREKAWELAVEGQEETMTKGDVTFTRVTYPNAALLQFLLKAYEPEVFGIERKEVKAGPLEAPPELIRSDSDRKKLTAKIRELQAKREAQSTAQKIVTADDVLDLL